MKIIVINPNSSKSVTDHIRVALMKIKQADTELTVICPEHGPISIESAYDETLAAFYVMDLVKKANEDGYNAIVLACFSDPGLDAAKEISTIPVIGIEEATLHMAAMLGHRFSIMTGMRRRILPANGMSVCAEWRHSMLPPPHWICLWRKWILNQTRPRNASWNWLVSALRKTGQK